jgi:outer membrane receptor protein involved in Fe transport
MTFNNTQAVRAGLPLMVAVCFAYFFLSLTTQAASGAAISGVVRDSSGAVVSEAEILLMNAQQSVIKTAKTDSQGRFTISDVPSGSYLLAIRFGGFAENRRAVTVRGSDPQDIEIVLEPQPISEQVTVTATPGSVESVESLSQQVNIINEREIEERAKAVVAQVATEEAGVHLQRTATVMSGIFVRGLTGNKVNIFVDGVRYSTSAQRGGVNTFLNLIEPTSLQAVEILRGPNSAQYGSDAIGGSIQFITRQPSFSTAGPEVDGKFGVFFSSSDAAFGSNLSTSVATRRFGLIANVAGSRHNNLRTGDERDSHNAVTRFFALSSDLVLDDRTPDTAFTQYGGSIKMNWAAAERSHFLVNYMRGQQDGGKRYDQLLGGDGNLIADLRNLMLDIFSVRFDQAGAGWFDNLTATYSFNSQREERVNQGGNGNPRATINHEYERLNANGIQINAAKQWGPRNSFLTGADYYHERINAPSYGLNPVSGVATLRRGRVPDNARYRRGGIYMQDLFDAIPGRLRLLGNVRYNVASYKARTSDAPIVGGRPLFVGDSMRTDDFTFRAGAVITAVEGLNFLFNVSRGFRAPHLTDLDTLGLTGSGFEISAAEVAGRNATVGDTADDKAVSTGEPVRQVKSETSLNYEAGVRYHNRRVDTDFAFFVNDISDNIVKQSLILPQGAVGQRLGSDIIISQGPTGVVFVAAATNPVLVRANLDDSRIYGFEHTFDVKVTRDWSASTVFTYLHAADKRTDLPPNIEGGTPAPEGWLKLRYQPAGKRFWIEPYIHAADRQERLSTLDLSDRRTGAARSRGSISNFFLNGATARGLVSPGPDGVIGNADDRLIATGETLLQIQNRVLGTGVGSVPLYTAVPGYVTFNVRGGIKLGERYDVLVDFENIGDRNYRGISWGVDAPGRGVFVRVNSRF